MRILLINKFHFLKGGAEKVYLEELALLREAGHEVHCFAMADPRNLPAGGDEEFFVSNVDPGTPGNPWQAARAAGRMLYSFASKRKLGALIDARGPFDVAHLHNIYHQLSPAILSTLKERGIPAAMTLHDFKVVCGTYSLLNQGELCERCSGGNFGAILKTRCNGGSLLRSGLTWAEMTLHHKLSNPYGAVDRFISPSQFLKNKIAAMGFHGRADVLPNPVRVPPAPSPAEAIIPDHLLYVGRLSREKGVDLLLTALAGVPQARLHLCGDGPERAALEAQSRSLGLDSRVEFIGQVGPDRVGEQLARAEALVLPSRCHENQPLSVMEAFARGRPAIGSDFGGIPELIETPGAGMIFKGNDAAALTAALQKFLMLPAAEKAAMGARGRTFAEENFTPEKHMRALLELFEEIMAASNRNKSENQLVNIK